MSRPSTLASPTAWRPARTGRRLAAFAVDLAVIQILQSGLIGVGVSSLTALVPAAYLFPLLYFWLLTGLTGRTVGKMALGIEVRTTHGPMTLRTAFLREVIGKPITVVLLFIGVIIIAADEQKRGIHDLIAGTRAVVRTPGAAPVSVRPTVAAPQEPFTREIEALLAERGLARWEWLGALPPNARSAALSRFALRYPGDVRLEEGGRTLRPTGSVEWF